MARSLEVVGERWTLLILRDAFFGVQRFGDFCAHLGVPRAILTERLALLVSAGLLDKVAGPGRREHYQLTDKGIALWPVLHMLGHWGDEYYAPDGPRRLFQHTPDEGALNEYSVCAACGLTVTAREVTILPGPGTRPPTADSDPVSTALYKPHRLLEPLMD